MLTADFDFQLPGELIAQQPVARGSARMLVFDRGAGSLEHSRVDRFPELLGPDDLLLLNDTRVIAARLQACRPTGRTFELLLLDQVDEQSWRALLRPSSRARAGERLELSDGGWAQPLTNEGEGCWRVSFDPPLDVDRLDGIGETPLPPYIRRPDGATEEDRTAYQTIYASAPGAVAAPTAGLHFTPEMLQAVRDRGVETVTTTLHVGIGTFRPVSVDRVADHRMHAERYNFSTKAAEAVNRARAERRRIVCVGTTSVRSMEGALAAGAGVVEKGWASTEIFITPGFSFQGVGAMMTNFHLPKSTLLMMISAFAGRKRILEVYREAVEQRYRFFSYGDAMVIL